MMEKCDILISKQKYETCSGYGPVAGSYEHCNELSGSIKGGEFVD
jgi:hypothetical protein